MENLEQNKREQQMSFNGTVASIGFFGGLIWSLVGYFAFFFNFIRVGPALVLMPFALGDWKNGYLGQLVGIALISFISIPISFLYRYILARFNSIWPGIGFGFVLWFIVFYFLNPIFPGLKPLVDLDLNSIITGICLYVLYGVFIGYSISYEYSERLK
ncbi:hypothetical protein BKP37_04155 [Anaerobacillus alkalilacustris]|uniref:Membrane protein YqhR n=1 Tax=Anaerobacillus alkalilacustris TaxID=393763 RepID=A0A1S2LXD8_9BACI|nr:YqhR family membrane protein [Anaerobacillus alkalilacustris]OIJ16860.1 hypothetical protein BKP37_04155 [Anaerobacillus alkalilacustris]